MLIDSNILIYAINADSPKSIKAREFLKENADKLEIAHQNIVETIRVLTHPKFSNPMNIKAAISAVEAITKVCRIICPSQTTYYLCLELLKKYKLTGNRIFDVYLAACALTNHINTIATDNVSDFRKFQDLKVINPFS